MRQTCQGLVRVYLAFHAIYLMADVTTLIYFRYNPVTEFADGDGHVSTGWGRYMRDLKSICGFLLIFSVILGFLAVGNKECPNTSPILYWTAFGILIFNLFLSFIPSLLVMSLICCLPCLIVWLRVAFPEPNRGASEENIKKLSTLKYSQSNRVYGEVIIPEEDATCTICLQKYEDNADIHILSCRHHFHQSCSDEWFRLQASCPLCKRSITGDFTDGQLQSV